MEWRNSERLTRNTGGVTTDNEMPDAKRRRTIADQPLELFMVRHKTMMHTAMHSVVTMFAGSTTERTYPHSGTSRSEQGDCHRQCRLICEHCIDARPNFNDDGWLLDELNKACALWEPWLQRKFFCDSKLLNMVRIVFGDDTVALVWTQFCNALVVMQRFKCRFSTPNFADIPLYRRGRRLMKVPLDGSPVSDSDKILSEQIKRKRDPIRIQAMQSAESKK